MAKQLFLIRHAHRDIESSRLTDNGLSEKGQAQALKLVKLFYRRLDLEDPMFFSSPKKRCIETLTPLSKSFGKKVEVMDLLDEGSSLFERIQEFIEWWMKNGPTCTVVCSHGDWIPECVYKMTGARIDCKKGSVVEIGGSTTAPLLINLIQKA